MNLLDMIRKDTNRKLTSTTHGGEYSGPCPFCHRGTDRFKVWPQVGRWACLGSQSGRAGCGRSGDAIDYLRQHDGLSYVEAKSQVKRFSSLCSYAHGIKSKEILAASTQPPSVVWQERARQWVEECESSLDSAQGKSAREWLHGRGLTDATIHNAHLGINPNNHYEDRSLWGLPPVLEHCNLRVWLPRGIVIPWLVQNVIWRVNIRRPLSSKEASEGQPKYVGPAGFTHALYGADALGPDRPVVMVEGEIDALTIQQTAGDLVVAVATGSTAGSRQAKWLAQLAIAPLVLVAFDVDANQAGDRAASWWLQVLDNARRWRPETYKDANAMHTAGLDVRKWVQTGLNVLGGFTSRASVGTLSTAEKGLPTW